MSTLFLSNPGRFLHEYPIGLGTICVSHGIFGSFDKEKKHNIFKIQF